MAIRRVDDLDGKTPVENSTKFGFNGVSYEIDLGPENFDKLKELLSPYIGVAKTINTATTTKQTRKVSKSGKSKEELAEIRMWANNNGYAVADRGRIKADIIEAFEKAQQ